MSAYRKYKCVARLIHWQLGDGIWRTEAGLGNQCNEPGDKIQRLEDHVGGASTPAVTLSDVVASRLSAF